MDSEAGRRIIEVGKQEAQAYGERWIQAGRYCREEDGTAADTLRDILLIS